jgi:AcrR family transcriptional regulator
MSDESRALGLGSGAAAALPMPPTQARGAEKRDRLYAAAMARFERYGVEGTRVEDIVDDAEVSWATFFRYFPRKEDVLLAGAARHFGPRVRDYARDGIAAGRPAHELIEDTLVALSTPGEMTPELHAASLLQVIAHPDRFAAILGDGSSLPLIELVGEVVVAGQRRGEIREDVPARVIATTIAAGAFFPGVRAAAAGGDPTAAMTMALALIWEGAAPKRRGGPVT